MYAPDVYIIHVHYALGKQSLALATHPKRDKLLRILPDLHPEILILQ